MENKETYKCKWCNEELTVDDIYINNTGFAYCCKCDMPLCDVMIQDKNHFIVKNFEKIGCSSKFKKFYKENIKKNKKWEFCITETKLCFNGRIS